MSLHDFPAEVWRMIIAYLPPINFVALYRAGKGCSWHAMLPDPNAFFDATVERLVRQNMEYEEHAKWVLGNLRSGSWTMTGWSLMDLLEGNFPCRTLTIVDHVRLLHTTGQHYLGLNEHRFIHLEMHTSVPHYSFDVEQNLWNGVAGLCICNLDAIIQRKATLKVDTDMTHLDASRLVPAFRMHYYRLATYIIRMGYDFIIGEVPPFEDVQWPPLPWGHDELRQEWNRFWKIPVEEISAAKKQRTRG